eukprot:TRINITY_DN7026_c0_g1_i1.p1 TRINITY_DN7026_c0_g1~~TRINITY_DN7026_c0_g1_i1.p1  ORF type:complete len:226 (-),score=62.39 TRINITY_DN7026_c0_g1_i1:476-1060(-)
MEAVDMAMRLGHVDALRWLHEPARRWSMYVGTGSRLLKPAILWGTIPALRWVVSTLSEEARAMQLGLYATAFAASVNNVDALRLLHASGFPLSVECFQWAAAAGHVQAMRWLCAEGCPTGDADAVVGTVLIKGNLDALQCLHSLGVGAWDERCVRQCLRRVAANLADQRTEEAKAVRLRACADWLRQQLPQDAE